jgi:hypothetical protein
MSREKGLTKKDGWWLGQAEGSITRHDSVHSLWRVTSSSLKVSSVWSTMGCQPTLGVAGAGGSSLLIANRRMKLSLYI